MFKIDHRNAAPEPKAHSFWSDWRVWTALGAVLVVTIVILVLCLKGKPNGRSSKNSRTGTQKLQRMQPSSGEVSQDTVQSEGFLDKVKNIPGWIKACASGALAVGAGALCLGVGSKSGSSSHGNGSKPASFTFIEKVRNNPNTTGTVLGVGIVGSILAYFGYQHCREPNVNGQLLLTKRPAYFYTSSDSHMLPDGGDLRDRVRKMHGGKYRDKHDRWFPFDVIGTRNDTEILRDFMSYDEMMLASLLTVSAPVQVINNGKKTNEGKLGEAGTFQTRAIYLAQVGSRFERENTMEWRHFIHQNGHAKYTRKDHCPEITKLFEQFYNADWSPGNWSTDSRTPKKQRTRTYRPDGSDRMVGTPPVVEKLDGYRQFRLASHRDRFRKQAKIHLEEGQFWGDEHNSNVRIYAVGLGDGCWSPSEFVEQGYYTGEIIQAYIDQIIEGKAQGRYGRITVVEFNYTSMASIFSSYLHGKVYKMDKSLLQDRREQYFHQESGVNFVFHPVHTEYSDGTSTGYKNAGCPFVPCSELIVSNMAWDGNSWLGNEYWAGALSASGDPAAACCSTLWNHLHPTLNREYMRGDRTMVSLEKGGFIRLRDYLAGNS